MCLRKIAIGFCFSLLFMACSKENVTSNPNLSISFYQDTVKFDTVFTGIGSATQIVKLFNYNDQKIDVRSIRIAGGDSSSYQLNVNGIAATSAGVDLPISGGDSSYLFIRVNIDPTKSSSPFVVADSIVMDVNGQHKAIALEAYGQNANYLSSQTQTQDTTWSNKLPIVLMKGFTVPANKTLTIEKGTQVYVHGKNGIFVNGNLKIAGTAASRVILRNDRLDADYKNLAGTWSGIVMKNAASTVQANFVSIWNATNGIVDSIATLSAQPNLKLNGAIIQNCSGDALQLTNANVQLVNCLLANAANVVNTTGNGIIDATYCTLAAMDNFNIYFNSVFNISTPTLWQISLQNCIASSADATNVFLTTSGSNISVYNLISNALSLPSNTVSSNSSINVDPDFVKIQPVNMLFDFHLQSNSPAKSFANPISNVTTDLEGNDRNLLKPTSGCYE